MPRVLDETKASRDELVRWLGRHEPASGLPRKSVLTSLVALAGSPCGAVPWSRVPGGPAARKQTLGARAQPGGPKSSIFSWDAWRLWCSWRLWRAELMFHLGLSYLFISGEHIHFPQVRTGSKQRGDLMLPCGTSCYQENPSMPLTKDGYTLYSRTVTLKGGQPADDLLLREGQAQERAPPSSRNGYEVATTTRTSLPILRRKGGSKWREMRAKSKKRAADRKAKRKAEAQGHDGRAQGARRRPPRGRKARKSAPKKAKKVVKKAKKVVKGKAKKVAPRRPRARPRRSSRPPRRARPRRPRPSAADGRLTPSPP